MALQISYCLDPKYRYKVLRGIIKEEVNNCLNIFAGQKGCRIEELNNM